MTRLELDRFNDLNRQGFMNFKAPKPRKLTKAEQQAQDKARADRLAAFDSETDAIYAKWAAEDAAALAIVS